MPYAELHAKSAFSFLEGASHPHELVGEALHQRLAGLALCDENGLYGVVEARDALVELAELSGKGAEAQAPLRLIYGSELSIEDGADSVTALVLDREGYRNLCRLVSEGRLAAEKGEFHLSRDALGRHIRGLHFLIGGARSAAFRALVEGDSAEAQRMLASQRELLGNEVSVELTRQLAPGDHQRSLALAQAAKRLQLPIVATNDVRFHTPDRKTFQDLLRCVRLKTTLAAAGRDLLPNAEAYLKSSLQMERLFADLPEAIGRTVEIAQTVSFRLCDVRYAFPAPDLPSASDADQVLAELCRSGLRKRLGTPSPEIWRRLQAELDLIKELQYAGYFLCMHHIVEVCAAKGILCQGRGSAANSLCCFALRITSVSPNTIDMLFERFLSRERNEPPDIDLDIEHERREEIIQYVYEQLGRDHAGMVAEVIRYRSRSALREVGKALGFSLTQLTRMSKFVTHTWGDLDAKALRAAGMVPEDPRVASLVSLAQSLDGMPRHLSIHVGGFVLSREKLSEIVPLENGRMAARSVIQWDKDGVDSMGMFKLDLLGLGMLTVLSRAFRLVAATTGDQHGLENIPADDPLVYEMIGRADTIGVFQIESRAQMNMLPRLKPTKFYDLVVEVAIVRPGPIQGKMVHPYLKRRRGHEKVEYPHPDLAPILGRTYGVPLFQEQVMRFAEAVGGYTPGEADQLRRDMASWRRSGKMERHRKKLIAGMLERNLSQEFAERVFEQIQGFGSYGFPESHAAAFAHLAYVSAYLKCHHPVAFAAALINSQPMGFYSPAVIVNDLKRHGHSVRSVDVQRSEWDCTVEDGALRLGFRLVRGFSEELAKRMVETRALKQFESIADLVGRAGVPRRQLVSLTAAGAVSTLTSEGSDRRSAVWAVSGMGMNGDLFRGQPLAEQSPVLTRLRAIEEVGLDARYAQSFSGRHPLELARETLQRSGVLRAVDLLTAEPGTIVMVAGLVITRQRPQTAAGVVFMTLEDETGNADLMVLPAQFSKFQTTARLASALVVRGRLRADGLARSVTVEWMAPLQQASTSIPSHDFH